MGRCCLRVDLAFWSRSVIKGSFTLASLSEGFVEGFVSIHFQFLAEQRQARLRIPSVLFCRDVDVRRIINSCSMGWCTQRSTISFVPDYPWSLVISNTLGIQVGLGTVRSPNRQTVYSSASPDSVYFFFIDPISQSTLSPLFGDHAGHSTPEKKAPGQTVKAPSRSWDAWEFALPPRASPFSFPKWKLEISFSDEFVTLTSH